MRSILAALILVVPASGFGQVAPSNPNITSKVTAPLDPLDPNLVMVFSMDGPENGSLVFSRPPALRAAELFTFSKANPFVKDGDRLCANFAERRTYLNLKGSLFLGSTFTMAIWAKLPFAGDDAVIWDGNNGTPLRVKGGNFVISQQRAEHALGPYDKSMTGWHHLAITGDGKTTSLYVDGAVNGSAPAAIDVDLRVVGSAAIPKRELNSQCDLLDDMFIFKRALTGPELQALSKARLPPNLPTISPGTVASINPDSAISSNPSTVFSPTNAVSPAAIELVKTYNQSLVFVSGEGAGSGFIANVGGKPFLLTNAHVAAGVRGAALKTLQGTAVKPGPASVAVGHDILGMETAATGTPLEVMRGVENIVVAGDDVVVLGNSEGGGVIIPIMGRIVGVGPQLVEVDAPFQPGNSGSPIIHLRTRKVVAIATYLVIRKYDPVTKRPLPEPSIRRFGYRIDSVKTWQPVNWNAFTSQAIEMEKIETLTNDLHAFVTDLAADRKIAPGAHTNPAIRNRIDAWIASKASTSSAKDAATADQNFISFVKARSQSDVTAARPQLTYDYFQRKLAEQQKQRTEITDALGKILVDLEKHR